jgi:hypothetical protein
LISLHTDELILVHELYDRAEVMFDVVDYLLLLIVYGLMWRLVRTQVVYFI